MAIDITNLDSRLKNYLGVNKDELISKAIFNSKFSRKMNLQTGVKNDTPIVRLDSTVEFADGSQCGFNAGGSDTMTQRTLNPGFIGVYKTYCSKDFLNTYKAYEVKMKATENPIPFEEYLINANLDQIGNNVEKAIFQGHKTDGTGVGNMAFNDGLDYHIQKAITDGVIPASNVIAKGSDSIWGRVQKLWIACDPTYAQGATILMSVSMFKQMIIDLTNSNMYHVFEEITEGEYSISMPGAAGTKIMGVEGMEGLDTIWMTQLDNLYYGVDLENDNETVDLYWDGSDRNWKFVVEFAIATQFAIPEGIYVNQ